MKFIYMGDLHLFDKQPSRRTDNLKFYQFKKLEQLVNWSNHYDARLLLGGDLFDKARPTAWLLNETIAFLKGAKRTPMVVLGQHEMPYHSPEFDKSPVYTLHVAGVVKLLNGGEYIHKDVKVCERHWDAEPEPPEDGMFNIFLSHTSVFEGEVPFYWKGEGYTPKTLKEKFPGYDLYLCGDIHAPLVEDGVVVSGPMMRRNISERDYKPRAYLIDIETLEITPLFFDIEDNVFEDVEDVVAVEQVDMTDLIDTINENQNLKESYQSTCIKLTEHHSRANQIVKEIIDAEISK